MTTMTATTTTLEPTVTSSTIPAATEPTAIQTASPAPPTETLTIEGKQFGRGGKSLFPNFEMPLPAAWHGAAITLRDLLDGVVRAEVAAFETRQAQRTVLQTLSATRIAEGVAKGKVDSGGSPDAAVTVDADEAVANALQSFEDGRYFVFVDGVQREALADSFTVGADTRVTFLRLVALVGG